MTYSLYQGHIYLGEEHYAWPKNGEVCLAKDSDGAYIQHFRNREELMSFVAHLLANADLAWPTKEVSNTTTDREVMP